MKVDFTGRHFPLDDEIREFTLKKLAKLEPFVEDPADAHVVLEVEKNRQIAEILVSHRHGSVQATESADTMMDAVNVVVDKIEKQARRARKKFMDKRRRAQRGEHHWPMDVIEAPSLQGGEAPRVVKTSRLPIKPMTIDEAALELERSKNEFFVFLDSTNDKVSVLYRRKDEHFGLIAPEV